MPELVDCHTHSVFSDGASTLLENMRAAVAAGITTIACTDHWGHADFIDCTMKGGRLGDYEKAINVVRTQFTELDIVFGLEADWYRGCMADLTGMRGGCTYLLGSVHYLCGKSIDWDRDVRIWEELGADGVWELYASEWCTAATSRLFDSMAHPDLPRVMSGLYAPERDLTPLYDDMAEAARVGGVHVEINTAGLTKSFGDFYPCEPLLRRFHEAGVPLTVGSDAHDACRVGADIREAYAFARRVGYAAIDAPTSEGGWRTIVL